MELLIFAICMLGWLGMAYLVYQKRSLFRWGFFILVSVWLYISIVLVIFTLSPSLPILLIVGLIPVIGWAVKSAAMAGKAKVIGTEVIKYFRDRSDLPDTKVTIDVDLDE